MRTSHVIAALSAALLVGCGGGSGQDTPPAGAPTANKLSGGGPMPSGRTFAGDVAFLKDHVDVVELGTGKGPGLVIVPQFQGRVMSSTFDAEAGMGIGFINYGVIEKGEVTKGMTAYGGEDRFWLGPEGGQFSIYFEEGEEQTGENWQTPPMIDSEAFEVVSQTANEAVFKRTASLTNASGTKFDFEVKRAVALLGKDSIAANLGIEVGTGTQVVAYETRNTLSNTSEQEWTKDKGLLSIWILSMFKHSKTTRVIVPYEMAASGPVVKDDYFGKVPKDRLVDKNGYLVFKCDGEMRTKIGLSPQRAKDVLGSYDPARRLLTIVQYNKPDGTTDYVNSQWAKKQSDPFKGDVVNSYNDGPFEPGGKAMGPFYEIETSSPALALKPKESYTHVHRTFHFTGPIEELQAIATAVLGVDLSEVEKALP